MGIIVKNIHIIGNNSYQGQYPFVAELRLIIKKAIDSGYSIPSHTTLLACDTLIRMMKNSGYWNLKDSFYNFTYNNSSLANFALIDWKNPSRLASSFGGMIYSVNGYQGDGATGYISTNFNQAEGVMWSLDSAGMDTIINTPGSGSSIFLTSTNNSTYWANSTTAAFRINRALNGTYSWDFSGNGYKYGARTDITTGEGVNGNGILQSASLPSTTIINNNVIELFRSLTSNSYSPRGISMIGLGAPMPYTLTQSFRTYYNNYLTSIGLSPIA